MCHCLKNVRPQSLFWPVFSCVRTEYGEIRTRKNYVFGYFSLVYLMIILRKFWYAILCKISREFKTSIEMKIAEYTVLSSYWLSKIGPPSLNLCKCKHFIHIAIQNIIVLLRMITLAEVIKGLKKFIDRYYPLRKTCSRSTTATLEYGLWTLFECPYCWFWTFIQWLRISVSISSYKNFQNQLRGPSFLFNDHGKYWLTDSI